MRRDPFPFPPKARWARWYLAIALLNYLCLAGGCHTIHGIAEDLASWSADGADRPRHAPARDADR